MTTPLTNRTRVCDFLLNYWDNRYNFEAATIKNNNTADADAGDLYPGMPLLLNGTQWETVPAGSVSGADGFFCDDKISEAIASGDTSTGKYQILVRGPALVNLDKVASDLDAAAYNLTTVRTAMRAFSPPIMELREPTQTEEQTT